MNTAPIASVPDDLTLLTATEMARLFDAGEVSSTEVTSQVLERIEHLNPVLSAFITVTADLAVDEARAADARRARGEQLSAIDGIPYSIKDLDETAGIRTTYGSRFFADNVPTEDNALAGQLRSTGGVLLGKTNTPHMGYKDMCENFVAPTCVNPWDTSRTPGGSSGGAASAVAARLGPFAHGGDGAGSIRTPAALTGTVGLKPTFGRVPLSPTKNPWSTRTHNGPIARNVQDAALLLSVMAGYDARDPMSVPLALEPFAPETALEGLRGKRALFSTTFGYGTVSEPVERNARHAAEVFAGLGVKVDEAEEMPWDNPSPLHMLLYVSSGYPELYREHPEWVEEELHELLERGDARRGPDIARGELLRARLYEQVERTMRDYDFIISPTTPMPAWSAKPGRGPQELNGLSLFPKLRRSFFLYPFNYTGQPAISLPSGFSADGLPTGFQIVGRRLADVEVLHAAFALEQALDLGISWPEPASRPAGLDAHITV